MKLACYKYPGGEFVTPEEFDARRRREATGKSVQAYCEECSCTVFSVNAVNPGPDKPSFFRHQTLGSGIEPPACSQRRDERMQGLHPDSWDKERGARLRSDFFKDDNLSVAFCFCRNMCGNKALPLDVFKLLIQRADRRRVWDYANLPLWAVSYILLVLDDFETTGKNGKPYGFCFKLAKPDKSSASALWLRSGECALEKRFLSNDDLMSSKRHPNPLDVSQERWIEVAADTSWLERYPSLSLSAIRQRCNG